MEAKSISELIEHIKSITLENNSVCWFRGHQDKGWELKPSVMRYFSRESERGLTNEFLWKANSRTLNPPKEGDRSAWLSLMQHYRLPTRLLDWSKSPLIALYFAVEKYILSDELIPQVDACIWVLLPGKLNLASGFRNYIYSVNHEYSKAMIAPAFTDSVVENNKIIAVSSIETDVRMMAQQSAFTIHSSSQCMDKHDRNFEFLYKVLIPHDYIRTICLELDLLGYKPSIVFPDLENLSNELRLRYSRLG